MTQTQPWWQTTTIYQIYPRSYADSNGDGIGDLRGIISKLDYLHDLGFETLWISPFFRSPQQDFGYDISDYLDVASEYGTMADVDELLREVHARGMRVLFDLVLNHTSIEHLWFQESRSSRGNPKRDWYLWRDGRPPSLFTPWAQRGARPPNNWKAIPGGSGWHFDGGTGQWYFANFLEFQPDLNWRNPDVKRTMLEIVRFWLEKGVDGFRLDIFHSVYKDARFRDNPFSLHFIPREGVAGFFQEYRYTLHQPETFALARELHGVLKAYEPERVTIGEVFGDDETVKRYLGEERDGLDMLFAWDLLNLRPTASFLRKVIRHYEALYPPPYTPVYVFGNHDRKRLLTRVGGDVRIAKLLALFQFTVRGVPVTYYGEEIGMEDGNFPAKTALDPLGQRYRWVPQFLLDALGLYVNRDGCRTPMQWDATENAGFCREGVSPWLPVHPNRRWANVKGQQGTEESLLLTYQKLLALRREQEPLRNGVLNLLEGPGIDRRMLVYTRESAGQLIVVAMNYSKKAVVFENPLACDRVLLAVGMEPPDALRVVEFPPLSGVVLGQGS